MVGNLEKLEVAHTTLGLGRSLDIWEHLLSPTNFGQSGSLDMLGDAEMHIHFLHAEKCFSASLDEWEVCTCYEKRLKNNSGSKAIWTCRDTKKKKSTTFGLNGSFFRACQEPV